MIRKWNVTIPMLTGNQPRKAYVYIPDSFRDDPEARFPVLYMFDGHNLFFDDDATYGKSWGLADYMDATRTPLIIAAVECNHDPDNGRLSEYSPFPFEDSAFGRVSPRGKETMDWMVKVFKPMIDHRYPTLPDRKYTFIGGSSMGGLMSLYAVTRYNHIFSRAAALSPSLWVAPKQVEWMIRRANIAPDTVVYMDYGSEEMKSHGNMKFPFLRTASLLLERNVMLDCRIVPGGEHTEASWELQIPFFMNALFCGLEE